MTLQQLKYAVEIANKGSISETARQLFITQPSLSNAIRELEEELGITIFTRTNKGVGISAEGAEFLGYARQMVEQAEFLEEKYMQAKPSKQYFRVSTQHYTFATDAFVELIKRFGSDEYEFAIHETKTHEIIDDVKNLRSEIGILYINDFNSKIIGKLLKESNLVFDKLITAKPHVFISVNNPLTRMKSVKVEDLEDYPCVTFEQGEYNSFYFSEEILSTLEHKRSIKVNDRAALVNLLIGVNAYTISTGIISAELNGDDFMAVPLEINEEIHVGTIMHKSVTLSRLGEIYLEALQRIATELVQP